MKIDKATINSLLILIGVTLLCTIISFFLITGNANWQLPFDLSFGIFGSAVVALFVSVISAKSKFFTLNKILYICKQVNFNFNKTYYVENDRLLVIANELVDNFEDFYQFYQDVDFLRIINCRYQKPITNLFNAFAKFENPFISITSQNDIKPVSQRDIEHLRLELIVIKTEFHKFICAYVDLYTLYDKELLNSIIELDDISTNPFEWNGTTKKHESIKQIISNRKLDKNLQQNK